MVLENYALTRYFGAANTGLITQSLSEIRQFAKGEIEDLDVKKKLDLNEFFDSNFVLSKAASKTFALLLASKRPKSLLTGATIDIGRALAVTNRLEFHHLFPKAYLKSRNYKKSGYDKHANICMLNLGNNREISDKKPSEYFLEIKQRLNHNLEEILESNFIKRDAFNAACNDEYEQFIDSRKISLEAEANKLVT